MYRATPHRGGLADYGARGSVTVTLLNLYHAKVYADLPQAELEDKYKAEL